MMTARFCPSFWTETIPGIFSKKEKRAKGKEAKQEL